MIDDISAQKSARKTELEKDIDLLASTIPKTSEASGKRYEGGGGAKGVEAWLEGTESIAR